MHLEGLGGFTLAGVAQIEAKRRDAAQDAPAGAESPRPSGGRPGPGSPGGVGSQLERGPERGVAGRLGPAFGG
jgi:hypothetical protein